MAVAYDAQSESHTGTTGSTSEGSFSWTHTPSGTPKGVLVYVFTNANADYISGVTYGGVAMTQVDEAADTAGEPGRCTAFFLGEGIPTGAQTVEVTRTNNTTVLYAVAFTVTAGTGMNTATTGVVKQTTDGTLAEQSVNDGSPGTNSLRFGGINSGLSAVPAAGANSTAGPGIDFGTRVVGTVRETTAGQGSRSVGFSSGTSDDRAAVYLAIYEVAAPTGIGVVGEASSSGNSTSIVANKPAGLDDGHVWLVIIALPDQDGVVIDTPTGWAHEGSVDSLTPGGQHLSFWTKEITNAAGEPSTVTFTKSTSGTAGDDQFETWSGAIGHLDGTDPVEAYGWLGLEDTSGSTHTTDSLTTGDDGDYVVSAFVQDQSTSDGAWAPSSPGTLVELHEAWTAAGNCGFAVYGEQRATAGAGAHSATQTTGGDNTRGSATGIIAVRFAVVGLTKDLADTITLSDAVSKTWDALKTLADTVTATDAPSKKPGPVKGDTLTLTDATSKAPKPGKADTITLSDTAVKGLGLTKADTLALSDALARAWAALRGAADTITLTDASSRAPGLSAADTVTLTDATGKAISPALADTLSLADALIRAVGKLAADTLTLTDLDDPVLTPGGSGLTKSLADMLTLTDALIKSITALRADTLTLTDATAKAAAVTRGDTVTLTDALVKGVGVLPTDTITLTDASGRGVYVAASDLITLSDSSAKAMGLQRGDSMTLSDVINVVGGATNWELSLSDTLSLVDDLARALNGQFQGAGDQARTILLDKFGIY